MENDLSCALELRRKGRLIESNQVIMELLQLDSHNASLHYQRAVGLDILGQEIESIPYYVKAIELGLPNDELEYAFVGLGTIYRSHGRFLESKALFELSISIFPGKEQMKVFYAMALYNLGEYRKAIEYLIDVLSWTTTNKDILKHYRAITYLGHRLESSSDEIVQLTKGSKKIYQSEKSIVEKVSDGLKNLSIGGFHTCEASEYDDYYLYFNDPEFETRKSALAEFTVMLGNWHSKCSFPFTPQHERKYDGYFAPYEPSHELNNYVEAFVLHHEQIKQDFPIMFKYIIRFLLEIEEEYQIPYELKFPEVNGRLFSILRKDVLIPNRYLLNKDKDFNMFLKEAGIPEIY